MSSQEHKQPIDKHGKAHTRSPTLSKSRKKVLVTTALTVLIGFLIIAKNASNAEILIHDHAKVDMAIVNPTHQQDLRLVKTKQFTLTSNNPSSVIPTDEDIIKLMSVMKIDEKVDAIVSQREKMLKGMQGIQNISLPDTGNLPAGPSDEISDVQKKQIGQLGAQIFAIMQGSMVSISESIENSIGKEKLTQAYINSAKQYYTADEVQAMIGFYDTPMGQSILEKQPKVNETAFRTLMGDAMPPTAEQMGDMRQTAEQMAEVMPQMQSILGDILAN